MLLSCTISIFLCTTSFVEAQDIHALELEAVRCERVVWEGADVDAVNTALLRKAALLAEASRYGEAASTLLRVRRYALTDEENYSLLRELFISSYLAGELEQACAAALEAGLISEPSAPRTLDHSKADILSLIPPLGHLYAHEPGEGLLSLMLNAVSVTWTVLQGCSGAWVASLLGGGMALNYTYNGERERTAALVEEYNQKERLKYLEALLKPVYDQIISSR